MTFPFSVAHVAHLADLLSEGDFDVDQDYTAAFDFDIPPDQNPGNPQADALPLLESDEDTLDNLFERYINTDQLHDEDSGLVTAAAATAIADTMSELTLITGLPMEADAHPRLERIHAYLDARDMASDRILAWQQPFDIGGEELAREAADNLSLGKTDDDAATQLAREEQAWEGDRVFREWWGARLQESEDLHLPGEVFGSGWLLEEQGEGWDDPAPWHGEGHDAVDPSKRRSFRAPKLVENPYVFGVIGYGLSAKIFHIPFINAVSDFKLYAVVQRSPKPDDDAGKDWPGIKLYRSAEELCADPDVDVVVITTAPVAHFELTKLAIENGKNVIVEKPFTPTSKEAFELADLANSKGVLLTVYQNRRWDQDFLTLKKILADGTLGRVVEFHTFFDRHRPEPRQQARWQDTQSPGTGAVYDLGTHLIDQVVDLFGIPTSVTGFTGSQRKGRGKGTSDDSCTVILRYHTEEEGESGLGLIATAKAGVISCEEKQLRFWVRGEKGTWKKWDLDTQEDQLKQGLRPGAPGYGLEAEPGLLTTIGSDGKISSTQVKGVEPQTYCEFYKKFAAALNGSKEEIPVDASRAAEVIKLVELARESSLQGKTLDVQ
ncbi:hypothetical protein DV736_g1545, partial [Chaetothyriales sp. CBS 134916]